MASKPNVTPVDEEVTFEELGMSGKPLITKTDLGGKITFVNKNYAILTDYKKEELIGKPHSIVRHPDMPESAFKDMWNTIKSNQVWEGYIKNLRGDGRYYWVIVRVEPMFDDNGEKIGYIALRREPVREELEKKIEEYKKIKEIESLI